MKTDYVITSDRAKWEAILLNRTREEAERELWLYGKANPAMRFVLRRMRGAKERRAA